MTPDVASQRGNHVRSYLAIGSNVGDRLAHLCFAIERLNAAEGIHVKAVSPVYETAAHTLSDDEAAPAYLNAVVEVDAFMEPGALLDAGLGIERERGRNRGAERRWAPRTLDVDLLLYGRRRVVQAGLEVPHPRLGARRFVLRPLADLAPDVYVPIPFDATVRELLAACGDDGVLRPTSYDLGGRCLDHNDTRPGPSA